MRLRIKIQYQLTPLVLRCARCACSLEIVGCASICVVVHVFAWRMFVRLREALLRVCVAACDINTPMRSIVNLRCVARCRRFVWTVSLRLHVCSMALFAWQSCALARWGNRFSFVE